MPRADAPLIRHLAQLHGDETAREWQTPPLVVLPAEGWGVYLWDALPGLIESVPAIERLAWDDAVYDLGELRDVIAERMGDVPGAALSAPRGRGRAWCRIRTLERYAAAQDVSAPWLRGPADLLAYHRAQGEGRYLAVEWWDEETDVPGAKARGLPRWPDVILVDREAPWDTHAAAYLYPNPACRGERVFGRGFCEYHQCVREPEVQLGCLGSYGLMGTEAIVSTAILAYLAATPDYPVEVRPTHEPTPREAKTARLKPWLREDLAHVLLVDPHRVGDYGHPSSTERTGTHASPRPHQRRGHWRRLVEHGRRVWVRPSWVGAREWTHEGATYRVLVE